MYLLLKVSSSPAIALERVKQQRKGKGNSSIRMDFLAGFIIALTYRTFIRGTSITPSLMNEFCLFISICNRKGRDMNCSGCEKLWLLQWPVWVSPLPRDASQQEMCADLPAHTAHSQRNTHHLPCRAAVPVLLPQDVCS